MPSRQDSQLIMTSERPFVARTAELAARLSLNSINNAEKYITGRSCVVNCVRVQWLGVF